MWSAHVNRTVQGAQQRLGAISRVRGYLNDNGVYTAYKAFVWPKRPLEPLTPKLTDPSEGRLRRSARLEGHKQQRQHHNYSVRQPPDHWRFSKEVSKAEYTMSGMT